MSGPDDASPEAVFAGLIGRLKESLVASGVSLFPRSPEAAVETYWESVRTRDRSHLSQAPEVGGAELFNELGRLWAREKLHALSGCVPTLARLYYTLTRDPPSGKPTGEQPPDYVYPLF